MIVPAIYPKNEGYIVIKKILKSILGSLLQAIELVAG